MADEPRQLLVAPEDLAMLESFLAFHDLEMVCIGRVKDDDDRLSWITRPIGSGQRIIQPTPQPSSADAEGNPVFKMEVAVRLDDVPSLMRINSEIVKIPGVLSVKVDDLPTSAVQQWMNENLP